MTALAAVGLACLAASPRRRSAAVLLSWTAVAVLPGILSTDPEARRVATLFPALAAAGALAAGELMRAACASVGARGARFLRSVVAPAAAGGFAVVCAGPYLQQRPSPPAVTMMAGAVARHLVPGALVIADLDSNYDTNNRVTFLVLDRLREGADAPCWRTVSAGDWPEIAWRPRLDLGQFQYASSFLAERRPALAGRRAWPRCVFLIHNLPGNAEKVEVLKDLYPGARATLERPVAGDPYFDFFVVDTGWERISALGRPEVRRDGDVLVRAGFYASEPVWATLGAGFRGSELTADGLTTAPGTDVLLARGLHGLTVRGATGADGLPEVRVRAAAGGPFRTVPLGLLESPRLAEIDLLRAPPALAYAGFRAPDRVGSVTAGVFTHVTVAPDGQFVALKIESDGWRVEVLGPGGDVAATWARPIAGRAWRDSAAVAVAADRSVTVLDVDVVARFDPAGRALGEVRLPFEGAGEEDLAANGDDELFVVSGAIDYVARVAVGGGVVGRLSPPAGAVRGRWTPIRVAAARKGVVAVADAAGSIHVFRRVGDGSRGWAWVRAIEPRWSGRPTTMAVREDGWIVAYYPSVKEWRVFDGDGAERTAADPAADLNALLRPNIPVLAGFDRLGRLWAWHDGSRSVWRLSPCDAGGTASGGERP